MKLRFEVNQAEAFRRGVDCPKSIVTVEVDPAEVDAKTRELIAKRMDGIDVCQMKGDGTGTARHLSPQGLLQPRRITAALPTFDELILAVKQDESQLSIMAKPAATVPARPFGDTSPRKLIP
jgi:hypothetical protein